MQRYNLKYCKKNCDKVYFPCILREQLILKIMFEWLHFHKAIVIQTCYQILIQKGEINISKFFFTSLFNWVLDVLACLRAHMVGLLACSRTWHAWGAFALTFVSNYSLYLCFAYSKNYDLAIKKYLYI